MSMDPTSTPINNEEIQSPMTLVDETTTPNLTPIVSGSSNVNPQSRETETQSQSLAPNESAQVRRRQTSIVWNHFTRERIDGKLKAICNYCKAKLLGDPKQGTSHLHEHFKTCKLRTTRDIRQAFIKTQQKGDEHVVIGTYAFNQEIARKELVNMIILHEYPMKMVEHLGFKNFCNAMQPLFKVVSRNTIRSDIMKFYSVEKEKTMKLLANNSSRIAITTDMWTSSNQNRGYMAVTAHYIDDSWILQSRIVRFIYVPTPHTAKVLSDNLIECMLDWNLDRKLSTLTVDNCTTNDAMIERILDKISPRSFILGGQLFHMRCCAHILNLIVKDGLSMIFDAIEKIRDSVNFWTATPKREEKFKETCDQVGIPYLKKLILDCKTRWNSTFLMLYVAIDYKDVFYRLSQREQQYKSFPSEDEWDMAKEISQRLELFYSVTELFSGTLYPTSNVYFPKICEVRLALNEWLECPKFIIHDMASIMITKFEKYWGAINGVMAVGTVLDPRYKMLLLDYFFPQIYGDASATEIEKVKIICQNLVTEYDGKIKDRESSSSSSRSVIDNVTSSIGRKENWKSNFAMYVNQQSVRMNPKSELDFYLEEPVLPSSDEEFDILAWWKTNGLKYPTLQIIARDFLAIPISTVASESAFSTSGRFLTPHRSRLCPDTLEAMMCLQDWLWANISGSSNSKVDPEFIGILEDLDIEDAESISPS